MSNYKRHIAALDLGSNSFHMLIAEVDSKSINYVYREKRLMRLFGDSFEHGYNISPQKISEAIDLIKYFKEKAEQYSAEIFAVATSAIRDAHNRDQFIKEVYKHTGITIRLVTGDEEAELALLSLQYSIKQLPQRFLLFDLGGGSTEFIFVEKGKIIKKYSFPIGAVRYTNKFSVNDADNLDSFKKMTELVETSLKDVKEFAYSFCCENFYGMGGTVSAVSMMIERNVFKRNTKYEKLRGYSFSYDELLAVSEIVCAAKTLAERKKIIGLEESRADIITAGVVILKTFFNLFGIERITFSWTGLREGIIIEALSEK